MSNQDIKKISGPTSRVATHHYEPVVHEATVEVVIPTCGTKLACVVDVRIKGIWMSGARSWERITILGIRSADQSLMFDASRLTGTERRVIAECVARAIDLHFNDDTTTEE